MQTPNVIMRAYQGLAVRKWPLVMIGMGFLFGKAMILNELAPFAAAFFAAIYMLRRDLSGWVALSLLAGNFFATHSSLWAVAAQIVLILLIQRGVEAYNRPESSYMPMIVFTSMMLVQLFGLVINSQLSWYPIMLAVLDGGLSFILTIVFMQALPILTRVRKQSALKNEEIICLIILLASVMTGAVGWVIYGISPDHVFSRYLILLFAFVGGAPLGASVGVVTGLILSLADFHAIYQMSLLAFAGMLAGMLREGKRWWVAGGMLLGSSILIIYLGTTQEALLSTYETVAAIVLFLVTPKSVIRMIAQYVPGTQDHAHTQHEYARRIRDMTADRVNQFSEVFRQLARSFGQVASSGEMVRKEEEFDHFINEVAGQMCTGCHRKEQCWEGRFHQTYTYMTDMMTALEENPKMTKKDFPKSWTKLCSKTDQVLETMKGQYDLYKNDQHWKRQIVDSRHFVAEQLTGVSQVMDSLVKEIQREGQVLYKQEEQIRIMLEELGLPIQDIDIICLDAGHVEIEIIHTFRRGHDECRKIIAPVLSDILGENIVVTNERYGAADGGRDGAVIVMFASAKAFEIDTGVASAAKGGDLLSGDSYSTVELGNGKFAVAISDGMGNGERAKLESSTALSILERLLQSGMDEQMAIKSVNSVLLLRSADEVFATVDMAIIDQYSAKTTFMKIGSTPSFIKRKNEVIPISAANLPIGILQDIEVELLTVQLQPGDTLIMMTDGIYDAPGHAVNKELWMKRVIQEITVDDPQMIADCLLDAAVRWHHGSITDDMTVVVAKVERHIPEWATVHWPGTTRLERPRSVS
ncbi:stage II sporulation protein E [Paenibacillus selenitireducens]|uniref:Stage II sporulation protein E n=1 Tax=Paenibacillus selenitireducens TaxID=1324314 RepID=A0A1T2WZY3_9BACL|nr:stage II sporulation protein E [Paenibacillus selenitireducens]OPA73178.1 stage II sporulation protein E [Paenibacillus selenitireducens]